MSEKKKDQRFRPWETANIVFRIQEQARKRKLLEEDMKQRRVRAKRAGPNTVDELEENKTRLKALRERLAQESTKK